MAAARSIAVALPAAKAPERSVNGRIFRAAVSVTSAGLVVKILATGKEFVVAGLYGRSDAMDAFLIAALIPALLVNLISESMNQALVPTFIRVRERSGLQAAQQLLSGAMLWTCLLLVAVSAGMALGAHGILSLIGSHFSAPKLALCRQIFYALLPLVLVTGIATNCTAVLNTIEKFALPALAPAVIPLSIIAGALLLSRNMGVWAMVWSTMAGSAFHAALTIWMLKLHGYPLRIHWYGGSEATREVARQYGPVLLSSVVASGGMIADQSMAAMLPPGSIAALAYAGRFVSVVLFLLAGAVSTAMTPYFSQMVAQADWAGCREALRTWVRNTAVVSIPVALAFIAGSRLLVRITFQHGVFGPQDTAVVASVLAMYALQIPFFVCSRVHYRFLVALRRTDIVLYCGVVNLLLDVILNLILMHWFGIAGIALATSLWTVSTFLFLQHWSSRLLARAQKEAIE